jgi:hypothetical protein
MVVLMAWERAAEADLVAFDAAASHHDRGVDGVEEAGGEVRGGHLDASPPETGSLPAPRRVSGVSPAWPSALSRDARTAISPRIVTKGHRGEVVGSGAASIGALIRVGR